MNKYLYRLSLIVCLTSMGLVSQAQSDTIYTSSGLQLIYADLRKEVMPEPGDKVYVHFTAMLVDGCVFESTLHNKPYKFTVGKNEVIPAWEEAIRLMAPGDRVTVYSPPEMAYGDKGIPLYNSEDAYLVPPGSYVYFKLWLVEIKDQNHFFLLK